MRGRFISSDMYDALELIKKIIDEMPEPSDAEDGWQLFKLYQARDCLRAAYDYEKAQESELMEGYY